MKPVPVAPFRTLFFKDLAMFFRVGFQFWRGLHFLRGTSKAITIFGSARLKDDHPFCLEAKKLARSISEKGIVVITGGGGAIMQAANQGAKEGGSHSIGINIKLPREQKINPYVTMELRCHYFFVRKVLLCRYSEAFVIFPGGFGTLDEFFELITLIQTNKMIERPVVLVGKAFWKGLFDWCEEILIPNGMITDSELGRIKVVETAEEVLQFLKLT